MVDQEFEYDCFISHASEDKDSFVRPLAEALEKNELRIWYDELTLDIGDSLTDSINRGIASSRFGIVVLSPAFFEKKWPQYELSGLTQRQNYKNGERVLLPILHNTTIEEVMHLAPPLTDILSLNSSSGIELIVSKITKKIKNANYNEQNALVTEDVLAQEEQDISNLIVVPQDISSIEEQIHTKDSLMKSLEFLLVDSKFKIQLFKLINATTENLYGILQTDFSHLNTLTPSAELIKDRMLTYDDLTENLRASIITGCYWGEDYQDAFWVRTLQRIVNSRLLNNPYTHSLNLQSYPAFILLYGAGLACLTQNNYKLLKKLWLDTTIYEGRYEKHSIISKLYPNDIIDSGILNHDSDQKLRTPLSDHLYEIMREEFSIFIPEDEQFATLFDRYEYLYGLEFGYQNQVRIGRFWAPPGRFHWRHFRSDSETHPSKILNKEIDSQGEEWPPIKAGLFGGSLSTLQSAKNEYDTLLKEVLWY